MAELEPDLDLEEQSRPSASEMLVAAREQSGMSQKEVADQLYLTTRCIRYLDEGAFDKILKPAFIRGYLRSYARVVGADGSEIVSRYGSELQVAEQSLKIRDVTDETVGSVNFTGPVLQTGLVGLLGVVVVVGVVWWFAADAGDEEMKVSPAAASAVVSSRAADDNSASAAADFEFVFQDEEITGRDGSDDQETLPGIMVSSDQVQAAVEDGDSSDGTTALVSSLKNVSIERISNGVVNYITLDAGGFDEIEIRFSGECWLEIEDGVGVSIYADLNKPGDVLRVYGVAPFSMLLGRANVVTMLFNGEPVDLAEFTVDDETAKVRLGR